MIPITDDRLIKIAGKTPPIMLLLETGRKDMPTESVNLADMATELLRLRSLVKRLVEDGERLAEHIDGTLQSADIIGAVDNPCMGITSEGYAIQKQSLDAHFAMLAEIKEAENG